MAMVSNSTSVCFYIIEVKNENGKDVLQLGKNREYMVLFRV